MLQKILAGIFAEISVTASKFPKTVKFGVATNMNYTVIYAGDAERCSCLDGLTYGELKEMFPAVDNGHPLPRPERLMKDFFDKRFISASFDDVVITVFFNGFCHCRSSGRATAYALSQCVEMIRKSANRKFMPDESEILRMPWYAPLLLTGMQRLENNRNGREKSMTGYHYGTDPDILTCTGLFSDSEETPAADDREGCKRNVPEWLNRALKTLTGRQEQVMRLVYIHGVTQKKAAQELHTSEANISAILKRAREKIRTGHPLLQYRRFVSLHK